MTVKIVVYFLLFFELRHETVFSGLRTTSITSSTVFFKAKIIASLFPPRYGAFKDLVVIDPIRNSPITIAGNLVEYELRLLKIVANCGLYIYSKTIFLGRYITVLYIVVSVSHCIASLSNNLKLSFGPVSSVELVRKSYSMPVP